MLGDVKPKLNTNNSPAPPVSMWSAPLLRLCDGALFDEEIVDFARLVDVDLDQSSGLRQPQPTLPPALVQ